MGLFSILSALPIFLLSTRYSPACPATPGRGEKDEREERVSLPPLDPAPLALWRSPLANSNRLMPLGKQRPYDQVSRHGAKREDAVADRGAPHPPASRLWFRPLAQLPHSAFRSRTIDA